MTTLANKTLFQLSYPLFLQSLVMFGVMIADMSIWSAHSPDTAAALSVAGQVVRIAVELSTVLGIGAVIVISRQLGRNDPDGARLTAEVACAANAVVGIGIGLALAILGPLALHLMALSPGIEADGASYLWLFSGATVFLCFGQAAVSALRGFGMSRTVMVLGVFGAVFYLALEYVLVLGWGPVEPLGATGAGLANLLTRATVAGVLAVVVIRRLDLRLKLRAWLAHLGLVREMTGLALPSVSDFIAYGFYQMIVVGLIATQGEVEILARAYVMIAMSFLTLVIMAVCQGSEVLISFRLGEGDPASARRQGVSSAIVATVLSTFCAVILFAAAGPFVGLFTDDPAVHRLSRDLLWLTIFLQPCFSVNMILFHALRALRDVRWPVIVSQGLSWGLGLPLAWYLCIHQGHGVIGVWYALIVEELAKASAMTFRWLTRSAVPQEPVVATEPGQ
ncbi:MAG: MATE family efflux transporter [Pseudooceanicola nanhaiensis]